MTNFKMSNSKYNFKKLSKTTYGSEIKKLKEERFAFNTNNKIIICNKKLLKKN